MVNPGLVGDVVGGGVVGGVVVGLTGDEGEVLPEGVCVGDVLEVDGAGAGVPLGWADAADATRGANSTADRLSTAAVCTDAERKVTYAPFCEVSGATPSAHPLLWLRSTAVFAQTNSQSSLWLLRSRGQRLSS